ncbi:MAG TPA: ADP-glyceromanno-heptose 6-epimerase [Candidatus Limnocylindria bacterium]|jgi:ADP-L-glycero-D-manno-heptose 6-epimerase|nr:ADP-glyceromanno-heptose 6-epimerase [Candidatus Limnocylindria bacterium]
MSAIRIVITGAAGFIGGQLLASFARRYPAAELLAVDHPVTDPKRANLAAAPGVAFLDHTTFIGALETGALAPELILHMGACSSTTELDWGYLEDNNLHYSQRLWQWCAKHDRRIIYASSAATYGDGSQGFDDESPLQTLQPLNLYGRSKHEFDLWVEQQIAAGRPRPAQSVGLKFFNVFGPGETHKGRMASMVFHGFHQIRREGVVRLFKSHRPDYPDGGQLRDFVYVRDLVTVIEGLAARPEISGLFNLGTGQAHSFRELIEALFAALNLAPQIEYVPMPEDLQGRYQYFTQATMRKLIRSGLPFVPTPLTGAVADYSRWLRRSCD